MIKMLEEMPEGDLRSFLEFLGSEEQNDAASEKLSEDLATSIALRESLRGTVKN
ncbi:MAG: hypothetical protein ACRBBK_09845 [Paracoccaceae bacterium]